MELEPEEGTVELALLAVVLWEFSEDDDGLSDDLFDGGI